MYPWFPDAIWLYKTINQEFINFSFRIRFYTYKFKLKTLEIILMNPANIFFIQSQP